MSTWLIIRLHDAARRRRPRRPAQGERADKPAGVARPFDAGGGSERAIPARTYCTSTFAVKGRVLH